GGDRRGQSQQQRPQQIELALDRQGPEVLDRAQRLLTRQVVHGLLRQYPVLVVQRRRTHLLQHTRPARGRQEQVRGRQDPRQNHHRRRDQPPGQTRPERRERDPSVP